MADRFQRKTYGRIFVSSPDHIDAVEEAIKRVDAFESTYAPMHLVAVYERGPNNLLVYLHKFEIDKDALTRACIDKGVWIWCVDGGRDECDFERITSNG